MPDSQSPPKKTLGVYTPYLQGFYFGELISQLQQYCFLKGYAFTVIKTDSFGTFSSTVHSDHIDFVVILRNAIHNQLAEHLVNAGKPVASIAYDYFPLAIPMVTSDNELGMELAFNHLIQQGHRTLAFVGDLSQFDIRKRYESFCDQHEMNGFELADDHIFIVNDTMFSGGFQAANEYITRNSQATGIICGASLTSIGFAKQLQNLQAADHKHSATGIVGFDAISLVPITQPNMAMIDQNLHLMAYKTIGILETLSQNKTFERHNFIEPKIITPTTDFMQAEDAFLATSTEIAELHNANYMKSIISNLYEWPKTIAQSNLDSLMTLAPMFEKYMQKACYGRIAISKDGREYIKIHKKFSPLKVTKLPPKDTSTLSISAQYPAPCADVFDSDIDTSVHTPIFRDNRLWSVLSIYGSSKKNKVPSSFSGFCAYLDSITTQLTLDILSKKSTHTTQPRNEDNQDAAIAGKIQWNADTGETFWDKNALSSLGLTSELEQNIYKNLDLTDRIHPDDDNLLREHLINAKETEFHIEIRLKHKNKSYQVVQIERAPIEHNKTETGDSNPNSIITLNITLQHNSE